MSNPTHPAPRSHRENTEGAAHMTMTLTPVYLWLIVLTPVLSGTSLVLNLVAIARGH